MRHRHAHLIRGLLRRENKVPTASLILALCAFVAVSVWLVARAEAPPAWHYKLWDLFANLCLAVVSASVVIVATQVVKEWGPATRRNEMIKFWGRNGVETVGRTGIVLPYFTNPAVPPKETGEPTVRLFDLAVADLPVTHLLSCPGLAVYEDVVLLKSLVATFSRHDLPSPEILFDIDFFNATEKVASPVGPYDKHEVKSQSVDQRLRDIDCLIVVGLYSNRLTAEALAKPSVAALVKTIVALDAAGSARLGGKIIPRPSGADLPADLPQLGDVPGYPNLDHNGPPRNVRIPETFRKVAGVPVSPGDQTDYVLFATAMLKFGWRKKPVRTFLLGGNRATGTMLVAQALEDESFRDKLMKAHASVPPRIWCGRDGSIPEVGVAVLGVRPPPDGKAVSPDILSCVIG